MGVNRRTTSTADDAETDEASGRSSSVSTRGWGAAKKNREENKSTEFADDFKITEEETLVKFLEDEPYSSLAEHWVDEIDEGKKSFFCIKKVSKDGCPLCAVGHKPKPKSFFNVVPLQGDNAGTVMRLPAGPMLLDTLEESNDSRQGPLSRHYWGIKKSVSGKGKRGKVQYHMQGYKADALRDDWETDPDDVTALLADVKPFDEDSITYPSVEDLEDIRDEHLV